MLNRIARRLRPFRPRRALFAGALLSLLFCLPQLVLMVASRDTIFSTTAEVPARKFGIVFGAAVYADGELSPAAEERIAAAVLLFERGKIERLFISGDNRHHREVEQLKAYAVSRGVPEKDITTDYLGIDTHDTCRHFQQTGTDRAVLLTQSFHLPRALLMCQREGIDGVGLAVNRLDLLASRGGGRMQIYKTRIGRFLRESGLTWSYLLGLYDRCSDEAEELEGRGDSSPGAAGG